MPENIVEKRRGADNRPLVCAISAGRGIGLGGGLTTSGTKGTIDHVYFPMCSVPKYFVARLVATLAVPQNIY